MKSSEGPASRVEEKVAMSHPQLVSHLIVGREEVTPPPHRPPLHEPSCLVPPHGWSTTSCWAGQSVGNKDSSWVPGRSFQVEGARLNPNLGTWAGPFLQVVEVTCLPGSHLSSCCTQQPGLVAPLKGYPQNEGNERVRFQQQEACEF